MDAYACYVAYVYIYYSMQLQLQLQGTYAITFSDCIRYASAVQYLDLLSHRHGCTGVGHGHWQDTYISMIKYD